MPRRFTSRKPLRDQVAGYAKILRALIPEGKPMPEPVASLAYLDKPKREVKNRSDPDELEAAVIQDVAAMLRDHPLIILAWRQNTGSLRNEQNVPIWFYHMVKAPVNEITLVDYMCVLITGRLAVLECKRRDWKWTGTDREVKQNALIECVRLSGGRGGFVTSAEQAKQIIES